MGTAPAVDLAAVLDELVRGVSEDDAYRSPDAAEREAACTGLARLAVGDMPGAAAILQPLGFTVATLVDAVTGRAFRSARSEAGGERRWGLYLVDTAAPVRLSIGVPHPRFDQFCEQLALRLWRAVPGSLLSVATVHRNAIDRASTTTPPQHADPARNPAALFHRHWTDVLGPRGIPQVQIHGFRNDTAPERVAVSTGAGVQTAAATRIADEIETVVTPTTRNWDGSAHPAIRATTNVQGIAARAQGWVWVHVEHNRTVREDPAIWEPAMDAVAAADPTLLGQHRPPPG